MHGVSGTPPESMLGHPHVQRVAGDKNAGFYRRWWESAGWGADSSVDRLEAYSWSGLTAGSGQRALWLLLTPFMLVNMAYWAVPHPPEAILGQESDDGRTSRRNRVRRLTGDAVQRLFAMSITLWFVVAVIVVSMDFVGWQCGRPDATCVQHIGWLGFLDWGWLAAPGRRLAVTAVVPIALVSLLWWLANKTWQLETDGAKMPSAEPTDLKTPLENRRVWNGALPLRRLRSVHITAAFVMIALLLTVPLAGPRWPFAWNRPASGAWVTVAAQVLATIEILLLALSILTLLWRKLTDRPEPGRPDDVDPPKRDTFSALPRLALVVVGFAVLLASVAAPDEVSGDRLAPLPWVAGTVQTIAAAQVALFCAVGVILVWLCWDRRRNPRPTADYPPAPAWHGFAPAVLLLAGSALAGAFAAGLALTVGHALGKPAPALDGADALVTPVVYFWAAALSVPVAAWAIVLAVAGVWRVRKQTDTILRPPGGRVAPAYPSAVLGPLLADRSRHGEPAALRARQIALAWARSTVGDIGQRLMSWFALPVVALLVVGTILYVANRGIADARFRFAVNLGDLLVVAFVAGLLYVGRTAYRNPRFRRSVGVLWDVGTFWPRMTHPLAPPCYAERAVPDLVQRIEYYRRSGGRVVLSCHSQGTVLGAATLMQLTKEQTKNVAFLTYGSPLTRLYARFFPSHFGGIALTRLGDFLHTHEAGVVPPPARDCWPWRNLYRPTDPIGGHVLRDYAAMENCGDNGDVDRCLVDPVFARAAGDSSYPPTYGHSGYPDDPEYPQIVQLLKKLRGAQSCAPGPVNDPAATSGDLSVSIAREKRK